jgi:hypothetical protein
MVLFWLAPRPSLVLLCCRYGGHLKERGYNALFFGAIVHGFISNINILNADSGIYCWGCVFTTMQVGE